MRNTTMTAIERSETSIRALAHNEEIGERGSQRLAVLRAWQQGSAAMITPCSMHALSIYITAIRDEHYFSRRQTNAEVIRKRTAELASGENPFLECRPNQPDNDGVRRNHYTVRRVR